MALRSGLEFYYGRPHIYLVPSRHLLLCQYRPVTSTASAVCRPPGILSFSNPGAPRPGAPLSHSEYARCVFDKTAVAGMCEVSEGVSMRIRIGSDNIMRRYLV